VAGSKPFDIGAQCYPFCRMSADDLLSDRVTSPEYDVEPHVQEWIDRARGGDSAAFGELCRHYRPKLIAAAGGRTRNDSEDLVQEVLIRSWQKRETIETPGLFFAILRNMLIDRARREEVRQRFAEQVAIGLSIETDEDARIDAERGHRCLAEAYALLPAEDRVLLTTKQQQGMTYEKMAAQFMKPEATIRRHVKGIAGRVKALVDICLKRGAR
jgi:RNA polymerase sigma factor (sigma-70 family)